MDVDDKLQGNTQGQSGDDGSLFGGSNNGGTDPQGSVDNGGTDPQSSANNSGTDPQGSANNSGKGDDSQKGDNKSGDGNKNPDGDNSAPETYEKFKLPEGMEYDEQLAINFADFARKQGLSQEKAQTLVDYYCSLAGDRVAVERQQLEKWCDEQEKDLKADTDFGGDKFDENVALAKAGLSAVAPPEMIEFVNSNWLGSFKPFVMMCRNIGKLTSEDKQSGGNSGKARFDTEDELANKMFGSGN